MAKIFLHGLALSNYRGIGQELQKIGPFQSMNFFIGPNNSGKSAILNFLADHLNSNGPRNPFGRDKWVREFKELDIHQGKYTSQVRFGLAVRSDEHPVKNNENENIKKSGSKVLDYFDEKGLLWLFPDAENKNLKFDTPDLKKVGEVLQEREWSILWNQLTRQSGGGLTAHWIPETIANLAGSATPSYADVKLIPAIRQISEAGVAFEDFSGKGLIDKLAELQNPPHDQRFLEKKFSKINNFLRSCTEINDARIEIPFDRRYILVHMGEKILPLSSLGTGIHEVIMLAAFCTLYDEQIVCIEEPEIHLHPLLQRKLVRYLVDNTENQYFIATHSASLIDATPAAIFSVRNQEGKTMISLAEEPTDRHEICQQLGYRASDLLQSNAIIWVEGPSDRIYLSHWIRHVAPELIEGTDYSIMFYGGRLLNHLTAKDPEINDFISLRRLNRNIAILIDSDFKSEVDELNDTKKRVLEELHDGMTWVTAGREMENYISAEKIEHIVRDMHSASFDSMIGVGKFENLLKFRKKENTGEVYVADKIKVAKVICNDRPDFSVLDLEDKLNSLVAFIEKANISN